MRCVCLRRTPTFSLRYVRFSRKVSLLCPTVLQSVQDSIWMSLPGSAVWLWIAFAAARKVTFWLGERMDAGTASNWSIQRISCPARRSLVREEELAAGLAGKPPGVRGRLQWQRAIAGALGCSSSCAHLLAFFPQARSRDFHMVVCWFLK